ncbi:MAG: hypothetical protein KGL39_03605, partial [Patescibacteria group bacterium]|nr:hypothetical protein [Patescibacteria group bacterium]
MATTTTTTSAPPQQYTQAYSNLVNQAQNVASQPLQQYSGPMVAGFTPAQLQAFNTVNNAQNTYQPYLNSASQYISNATTPIWNNVQQYSPQAISGYMSPYTQNVVNATQAQFNNQNAQQQQQLVGNAISQGAWGGDRSAIAQSELANQQQLAQAPVIAGLQNQGFTQAQQEFNTQQQAQLGAQEANAWLNSQAGFGFANLANEAQNLPIQAASAQLQTGALQQQLAQEQLNVPYYQFQAQQAYPFQTTGWLSNIVEGLGGASGGTSTTSVPSPSTTSQILGGALGLTGLLGSTGAFGSSGYLTGSNGLINSIGSFLGFKQGGAVPAFASGGSSDQGISLAKDMASSPFGYDIPTISDPLSGTVVSIVPETPTLGSHGSKGLPGAHEVQPAADPLSMNSLLSMATQLGHLRSNSAPTPENAPSDLSPLGSNFGTASAADIYNANMLPFKKGGIVPTRDDGGEIGMLGDDPLIDAPGTGTPDSESPVQAPMRPTASAIPPDSALPYLAPPQGTDYGAGFPQIQRRDVAPVSITPDKVDPWMALMAAGAGTLAGNSPYALQNIGRGALAGLEEYQGEKKQAFQEAQAKANVALNNESAQQRADSLYDEAQQRLAAYKQAGQTHAEDTALRMKQMDEQQTEAAARNKLLEQQIAESKIPPDVRAAQWLSTATPEQKAAFMQMTSLKAGLPPGMGLTPNDTTAQGADYLKTLPENERTMIQGMIDGRIMPPSSFAIQKPYWQKLISDASRVDPNFDQTTWAGRVATRRDFASGQAAKNLTAINTALMHAGVLSQAFDKLNNGEFPSWNAA